MNNRRIKNRNATIFLIDQVRKFCTPKNNTPCPLPDQFVYYFNKPGFSVGREYPFTQLIKYSVMNKLPVFRIWDQGNNLLLSQLCLKEVLLHRDPGTQQGNFFYVVICDFFSSCFGNMYQRNIDA